MDFIVFIINFLFTVYYLLLALRAILPWLPHDRRSPLFSPIYALTDPVLAPIQLGLPPQRIGMDVSPFVAIFLFWLARNILSLLLKV